MERVVVIGAGIVGAAAAARLATAGAQVTVIDDGAPGGATAAGAGIIASIGSQPADDETVAFRFAAARHYPDLVERCAAVGIGGHSYRAAGQLTVALAESESDDLRADFERSSALVGRFGPGAVGQPELLDEQQIATRYPLLGRTFGGFLAPEVAVVDGAAMRDCLLQLAVSAGAEIVAGTAALGARQDDGRVTAVHVGSTRWYSDAVVVSAGAWSAGLVAALAGRIQPQRGQIVHLHLPGASALPTVDAVAGHYLLTFPGDRVVIGATRETGSGFVPTLTAGGVAQVLAQGFSLLPGLAAARWIEARVGLRPASVDGSPLLGRAPGHQNVWLATGMGRSGLTLGPYSGTVVADAVLAASTDSAGPVIPAAFDPARF